MIKSVILDFGGVLFKNKPKDEWLGEKDILKIDPNLWNKAGLGLIDDEQVFKVVAKVYQVEPEDIKEWLFSRREPNRELLNLLKKLKPEVKKAVINNGLKTLFRGFLAKYDLSIEFDAMSNSAEEGVKKPDPKIYLDTCQKLGVQPEECLFVDDDENNIKGAEILGMKAVYFKGAEDLEKEFKLLNLLK